MARESKPAAEETPESPYSSERSASDLFDVPGTERGGVPDLLRRVMTVGLSGLFTTESAIRGALGDTVPREWVDFVASQSERTRDEFLARLAQEFVRILESVDLVELAEQLLEGRTVEVKAELKLGPRTGSPRKPARESNSDATKSNPTKPNPMKSKMRKESRS